MERIHGKIERPTDEFDHELEQTDVDLIAMADEFLKFKDSTKLTFGDYVSQMSAEDVLRRIETTKFSKTLASPDEQLAIKSNGEYYPILDIRKENANLIGVGIRVWGWDSPKYRYTNSSQDEPPYDFKEYINEIDKERQIDISFSYATDDTTITETIILRANSARPGGAEGYSQLYCVSYAEMGYEGHEGKYLNDVNEQDIYQFLDLVAEMAGDEILSVGESKRRQMANILEGASKVGAEDLVRELIDITWEAQARYILTTQTSAGFSIAEGLKSSANSEFAKDMLRARIKEWRERI